MVPGSPITRSPPTSISALSDFTIEDTSDEEPLVGPTTISTLRTGTSRCRAGIRCSVSTPASCHFILLPFVGYSPRPAWQRQNLPTTVPVFFPQTRQQISRTEQSAGFRNIHRITAEYEMPAVRSPLLGAIRGAYSETFEGLDPSKALGECFQRAGPTRARSSTCSFGRNSRPRCQCMAVRRGLDSLMDGRLSASARLPPETLQIAIRGLVTLREMGLKETRRLVLGQEAAHQCASTARPLRSAVWPTTTMWEAYQSLVDRITDSCGSGTKILQVAPLGDVRDDDRYGFCEDYVRERGRRLGPRRQMCLG